MMFMQFGRSVLDVIKVVMEGEGQQTGQSGMMQEGVREQLVGMGFELERIEVALGKFGSKEQAIEYLLKGSGEVQSEGEEHNNESEDFEDDEEDCKMVFVVRMDLKLALNKMAELVATATLDAYKQMEQASHVDDLKECAFITWTEGQAKKIVVKAQSEKDLTKVIERARKANINHVVLTELPSKLIVQKDAEPAPKKKTKAKNKEHTKKEAKPEENPAQMKPEGKVSPCQTKMEVEEKAKPSQQTKMAVEEEVSVINESKVTKKGQEAQQKKSEAVKMQPEKKMEETVPQMPVLVMVAFGPASESELDVLTKHFKLL